MLLTITLIISALVALNFLLLKFSVNKIEKTAKSNKTIVVLNPELAVATSGSQNLAPTGS